MTYYYNNIPYYYYMGTYYLWNETASAYQVVEPPEEIKLQAEADQAAAENNAETNAAEAPSVEDSATASREARDRYECHAWAVSESDFDPSIQNASGSDSQITRYNDSLRACLETRGYVVGASP